MATYAEGYSSRDWGDGSLDSVFVVQNALIGSGCGSPAKLARGPFRCHSSTPTR